ncbi:amidase signature enzyme [Piedraia hortae CBS 480.64]|uniref:Glutamyl-tRNA(Gln) amidotransferase subunit A, mitochondrial n=1 Tax=Piedraia hortae CBS 480.64 TaxID=1314780 RepID=A0A6A7C0T6_9PEZI|nr:amidase signature enzyme [Piedraia hortae CBS 480.64]
MRVQSLLHRLSTKTGIPRNDPYNALIKENTFSPRNAPLPSLPLSGKTISIKDNIFTLSPPVTTCASAVLKNYQPPYEATCVSLLRAAGAVISAKTNMDEFGMGSHSQNSFFGGVENPCTESDWHSTNASKHDLPQQQPQKPHQQPRLSPGGSSGGSAVSVSTSHSWAALGTDTGGSVRLPAAYCGIVGFKPSYGRISRWGVIPYANSLDTVGVLSRTVNQARQVFHTLDREDERDPTAWATSLRQTVKKNHPLPRHLRIGIPKEYLLLEELCPAIKKSYLSTLQALESRGHTLALLSLPLTKSALAAYYILAPAEASSNLAKYDGVRYGTRREDYVATRALFGAEVQRRILLGSYTLSSSARENYFVQAQKVRRLVQREFDSVFARGNPLSEGDGDKREGVDVILTPTAPTPAPTLDRVNAQEPVEAYLNDVFTVPASLAGLPALSVPLVDGSVQILGQFGDDELVLRMGEEVQA